MDAVGAEDFAGFVDPSVKPPDPEKWPEAYDKNGNLTADAAKLRLRSAELWGPALKAFEQIEERLSALEAQLEG